MSPRIDPALPLVWRSPSELQLGGEVPRVVVRDPGRLETGLLSALRHGASRATLLTIGGALGGTAAEIDRLLAVLAPAFELEGGEAATPEAPGPVLLDADGAFGALLERRLVELGHLVAGPGTIEAGATPAPALVVIAAHWVVPPARHLPWLRADVPHLAIVDDEAGWRVGPLVDPGAGPCLRCLELARRDRDPAWPVIAAQLAGRPAPPAARGIRALVDAASAAAAAVDDRLRLGESQLAGRSLRLGAAGGSQAASHRPHPECGCRAPGGNATAPALRAARRRGAPSSARASAVPA